MNERIKQLIEQASRRIIETDGAPIISTEFDKEKFAELIVRECADVLVAEVNRLDGLKYFVAAQTMDTAQFLIKKHFGVEE